MHFLKTHFNTLLILAFFIILFLYFSIYSENKLSKPYEYEIDKDISDDA